MVKPKPSKKPFFARFLESQELAKVDGSGTLKYPSDRDEDVDPRLPSDGGDSGNGH
jgi:Serine endopeptidase inhibitors